MDKEVLNTAEAAKFLGFSLFAVRNMARRGALPAKKIGKEWRFHKPSLVAWLSAGANQPIGSNSEKGLAE